MSGHAARDGAISRGIITAQAYFSFRVSVALATRRAAIPAADEEFRRHETYSIIHSK